MKREIITAASYPALEDKLVAIVCHYQAHDPLTPILILTPTAELSDYIASQIVRGQDSGILNLWPMAIHQLAENLCRRHDPEFGGLLDAGMARIALDALADSQLPACAPGRTWLSPAWLNTIGELKNAGIDREWLEQTIAHADAPAALRSLTQYWRLYETRLHTGKLYDEPRLLRAAQLHLATSGWLKTFPQLVVYGFYHLAFSEAEFLRRLFVLKRHLTVLLPYDPDQPLYRPVYEWIEELRTQGFEWKAGSQTTVATPCPVELWTVPSEWRESQFITERSRDCLHSGQGVTTPTVGIWSRRPQATAYWQTILAGQHLPVQMVRPFWRDVPECRLFTSLVAFLRADFSWEKFDELVESPLLRLDQLLPPALQPFFLASEWKRLVRDLNIREGSLAWQEGLAAFLRRKAATIPNPSAHATLPEPAAEPEAEAIPLSGSPEHWQRVAQALSAFWEFCQKLSQELQTQSDYAGMVHKLWQALATICPPSPEREQLWAKLSSLAKLDAWGIPVQWYTLANGVEQIFAQERREIEILQTASRWQPAGDSQSSYGQPICLADFTQALGIVRDFILLPGMTEEAMGNRHPETILTDADRQTIMGWLPTTGRRQGLWLVRENGELEKIALQLLLTSARQGLIVSWPRLQSWSGQEYQAAAVIAELAAALHQEIRTVDSGALYSSLIEYDLKLAQLAYDRLPELWTRLAQQYPLFGLAAQHLACRFKTSTATQYDGLLQDAISLERLATHHSPTLRRQIPARMLETYAICPLRYWLRYILQIKPWNTPVAVPILTPFQQSKLLVTILSRLAQAETLETPTLETIREIISTTQLAQQWQKLYPPMIWEVAAQKLSHTLHYYVQAALQQPDDFVAKYFQVAYGPQEGGPSLPIGLNKNLHFTGTLDQISIGKSVAAHDPQQLAHGQQHPTKVRAVQYYTTGGRLDKWEDNELHEGENLGPAIDFMALTRQFPEGAIERVTYQYWDEQGNAHEVHFSSQGWERKRAQLQEICQKIVNGIENGLFAPLPEKSKCDYCPYRPICRLHGTCE